MATIRPVSMTTFLDFSSKSGTAKLTVVRAFKEQGEYDPATDFYKKIREAMTECFEKGKSILTLKEWIETVNVKKRTHYRTVLGGVGKFIGRKTVAWFEPPRASHALGPVTVIVNPELGLVLNGESHVIKLYLKDEALKPSRAELILYLMRQSLGTRIDGNRVGVLDARTGRLFAAMPKTRGLDVLLMTEAASFAAIYGSS